MKLYWGILLFFKAYIMFVAEAMFLHCHYQQKLAAK